MVNAYRVSRENCIRKGTAPAIMTGILPLCLNLFQKKTSKLSLKKKRLNATWDDDFCGKVLLPSTL